MKVGYLGLKSILFVALFAVAGCSKGKISVPPPEQPTLEQRLENEEQERVEPSASFESTVKPMLAANCAPCHIPGGKMYERLPFDRPDTVRSKSESILRRLKSPQDRQTLRDWLHNSSGNRPSQGTRDNRIPE